ncbi:hypothetical protein ACLB2K_031291 [Fragaria x ananassa]
MVEIVEDPSDSSTQIEKELFQFVDTSLPQASNLVNHPDFHTFREQAAKEKAEAEAYRVRIAELENEQFLLRATLDNRNVYNDSLDCAARVAGTLDPAVLATLLNVLSKGMIAVNASSDAACHLADEEIVTDVSARSKLLSQAGGSRCHLI